jgi:hypothetical protein
MILAAKGKDKEAENSSGFRKKIFLSPFLSIFQQI